MSEIKKIIIIALTVLLVGTGVTMYVLFSKYMPKVSEKHVSYIIKEPFTTDVKDSSVLLVRVSVSLELLNKESQVIVEEKTEMIKDTIVSVLRDKTEKQYLAQDKIKQEITDRLNKIMQKEVVDKVYFTEFIIQ